MSDGWVIDSSIGISWVHAEQATVEADALLRQVSAGPLFLVPHFWFVETANILLVLQRRKRITPSDRATYLASLEGLRLQIDNEAPQIAYHAVSELAEKHGLTVYDATYLELALRRKLGLATRDEALRRVAKTLGVKTL
jgi:predicted nucleic acid-binding protein